MNGFTKTFILTLTLLWTAGLLADDRTLDDALATLEKSKQTRAQIARTLPQRELASLKEEEMALAQEFRDLMQSDDDNAYFDEIDKLID